MNKLEKLRLALKALFCIKNRFVFLKDYLKKTEKAEIIYELRNNVKIKVRAGTADNGMFNEIWLNEDYPLKKSDETIIDIGAHIGLFSIYAATKTKARIYSFEPEKENFNLLTENIRLNKLQERIAASKSAVSSKKRKIILFINEQHTGRHSNIFKTKKKQLVEAITLKDIFEHNKIEKCDLLKIDVEGSEYDIILHTPARIFEKISRIYIECHKKEDILYNFLKTKGYKVEKHPTRSYLYARK